MQKLLIFDTTLRDGEQAPGAALTSRQKLEVALQLQNLGVDIIEAGFPIASRGDFKAVENVARTIKKCTICGLARSLKKDIETAHAALKKAKKERIHIFLATSEIHLKYKFKKAREEILRIAKEAVRRGRKLCPDIEFSPEDASRTKKDFLFKVIEEVIKEGARTVNIPDTVGFSYPGEYGQLIKDIFNNVPNIDKAVISCHCHDDLGLATANSLAAVLSGARQVHCTINGIGERAGNAALEEIVMAVKTRRDVFKNLSVGVNTKEITRSSRLVSALTGFAVAPNKAIVGRNAFRHESGIHQDAILKKRSTYEIMNPHTIGLKGTAIVLGKHSGRHALAAALEKLGFKLKKEELDNAFKKFKDLADKKKEIFDDDLLAIMAEGTKQQRRSFNLKEVKVITGTNIKPVASVSIKYRGKVYASQASGDGPIDSCYRAIDKISKIKTKLLQYKLDALTSGKDAQGKVKVELKAKGKIVSGFSSSTDIIEASVKAYLDALNKIS